MKKIKEILLVFVLFVGVLNVKALTSDNITYENEGVTESLTSAIDKLYSELKEYKTNGSVTSTEMLEGYTGYAKGKLVSGSIKKKGSTTYTPGVNNQIINRGQYLDEDQTILGDKDLVPENIKSGVELFGVNGTYTSDANATASQILSGKTAYVNGNKITGTRTAQNDNYRVLHTTMRQIGSDNSTCSDSYTFTSTAPGKLIVFTGGTSTTGNLNSSYSASVSIAGANKNATYTISDAWQGQSYWLINVSTNQKVVANVSVVGSNLKSCSLFVTYVQ